MMWDLMQIRLKSFLRSVVLKKLNVRSFKMIKKLFILSVLFVLGCNAGKDKTNIELVQGMMDQESIKAQDWDPKNPHSRTMRTPPAGTVPRGYTPYKYKKYEADLAEKNLKNPLAGVFTPQVLKEGHKYFQIYCALCHGAQGKGDGQIAAYMPLKPPPLISERVKNFKDGRIFHIITMGKGVMGSYANQIISPKSRWAVVNYIRTLQRKKKAEK
ncbi:MAG: cytochrome c [Bdellovibrio sp.]|nr:MAG: cytochrome c [Bdellovibrio sp.]